MEETHKQSKHAFKLWLSTSRNAEPDELYQLRTQLSQQIRKAVARLEFHPSETAHGEIIIYLDGSPDYMRRIVLSSNKVEAEVLEYSKVVSNFSKQRFLNRTSHLMFHI